MRQLRDVDSWRSVSLSMSVKEWTSGMQVADDAIAAGGPWMSSPDTIPNMLVIKELTVEHAQVRLRARTLLKRSLQKEVPPPPRVVAVEEFLQPRPGKAVAKAVSLPVLARPTAPRASPEEAKIAQL